jgi:hypothetical protein
MSAHPATPDALIEAYASDVMRRLPRRQRNDVGYELRALLAEELRGRAADAGRLPDEAMALDLLGGFGHPDDVAARYHPPGEPIIPPAQTAGFAWATIIGVLLQWAVTVPIAMREADGAVWIGRWWISYGLGAFWWPGFLVSMMLAAAFVRQRWPAARETWRPKVVDRDHVNRGLFLLGLACSLAGIGLWIALAWWATTTTAETPIAKVFEFDADFLATRAPVVLVYWTLGIVLLAVVTVEGRWRKLTRRFDLGLKLVCCAMLAWIALGGRVFATETTNASVEGALWLLIVVLLIDVAWRLWRDRSRIRPPAQATVQQG